MNDLSFEPGDQRQKGLGDRNWLGNLFSDSRTRRWELVKKGHLCDCEFFVGLDPDECEGEAVTHRLRRFTCHKVVLATASEVFERMFYGEFSENPIIVDDVEGDVFELLLKYIYTYELNARDVSNPQLRKLIYLGYKYMMQDFIDACVLMLKQRQIWLLPDMLPTYQLACVYDNLPLMLACYERIQTNYRYLLAHRSFFDLDLLQLKRLVIFLGQKAESDRLLLLRALESYGHHHQLRHCEDVPQNLPKQSELKHIACLLKIQPRVRSYLYDNLE